MDGGYRQSPGLEGNVVINAIGFTEQASLLGGAGNDTIMIDNLATGSVVQGGTGNNQQNELEIIGESAPVFVVEGTHNGQADLAINGTVAEEPPTSRSSWWSGTPRPPQHRGNQVQINGNSIPERDPGRRQRRRLTNDFTTYGGTNTLVGGSGVNDFTVNNGTNTLFGGSGTNNLTVSGGTSTLLGGGGPNTYNLNGAGTYVVLGGGGTNMFNASGGTGTITGGTGENSYYLTGAGHLHYNRRPGRECPGMSSAPQ